MKASELFGDLMAFDDTEISGIFIDSRKITPGGVFVCQKGDNTNGHKFAKEAEKKGAACIVAEDKIEVNVPVIYVADCAEVLARISQKFYNNPKDKLKIIGVTGTNGKTSVTYLIKSILNAAGKKVGIIGTNDFLADDKKIDFKSTMPTTPNALELAQIFNEMVKSDIEYVVMEVSSHALSQKRVWGIDFLVGVFTNLTCDHLDFHKTMEAYGNEKKKLFSQSKTAVINTDSSYGIQMASAIKIPLISVGLHDAEISASAVKLGEDYVEFFLEEYDIKYPIRLNIPGKFSVYNALCAIGAARGIGISYEDIIKGLAKVENVKGRIEAVCADVPYKIFIDYAHSPDSLENILHTARGFTKGRVIVVFGCGGDRDNKKRPLMGEVAGRIADFSVITSDNPRTENPVAIIEDIKIGIDRTDGEYIIIVNRKEAIEYALKVAKEKDTVLLCGKGQENYQIIGKEKFPFDERKIVKEALDKLRKDTEGDKR